MSRVRRFNDAVARVVTNAVGTMWCAYAFALIALTGLPAVLGSTIIPSRAAAIVLWVSSEFLQLVLLSVILVGQNLQANRTDELVERHDHTHRVLAELRRHLGVTSASSSEVVGPSGEGA